MISSLSTLAKKKANGMSRYFGVVGKKAQRQMENDFREIRKHESAVAGLSAEQFAEQSNSLRESEPNDDDVVLRYAGIVVNAVTRTIGFRLHDVQVQAIAAGVRGAIVQMQTGEGKTVVTGSVAAIKTVQVPSVHVGTTNAYLAGRDLEYMQGVFDYLNISYGLLPEKSENSETRKVYQCQITYGPGYQFGFDYLRDQVTLREQRLSRLGRKTINRISGFEPQHLLVQPPEYHAMLIDEADSVMIDEAVTPLVISGGTSECDNPKPYLIAKQLADSFEEGSDYTIHPETKAIELDDVTVEKCFDEIRSGKRLKLERPWKTYVVNAIRAEKSFRRDVDYIIQEGKIAIVDQNTGRIFEDRTWQDGLHQAVECKEGVTINSPEGSIARVTRQRYLELYNHLSGFTGTAMPVAEEFHSVYGRDVVVIPTNLKSKRVHLKTRFFADDESKFQAIGQETASRHQTGQPILLGARTIDESRLVQHAVAQQGLDCRVLNGIQDDDEAEIVSRAGHFRALTIATNMAGRGTDIKPDERALAAGGLHVIATSPNMSSRIDRQLAGRAARQGDPGSCQFFVSACDEVIAVHDPSLAKQIRNDADSNGETRRDFSAQLARLQQVVERKFSQQRRQMVMQDRWMNKVRESMEKEA